jgi:hypothetical protein
MEILQLLCSLHCLLANPHNLSHSYSLDSLGMDCKENSVSNSSSIFACVFIAMGTCMFVKELLNNGSCNLLILWSLPSNRSTCYNTLSINHSLKYIYIKIHFESWLYSCLQVTDICYTGRLFEGFVKVQPFCYEETLC